MGISPEEFKAMQERVAKNKRSRVVPIPNPEVPKPESLPEPRIGRTPFISALSLQLRDLISFDTYRFTYRGLPIGKPRMTQRDKWQKRPCVLAYRKFCDDIRDQAGSLPANPDGVIVSAFSPMASSWKETKKRTMEGKPNRQKPDHDNIAKAVGDALFDEDCCIWIGATLKFWCRQGDERLEVEVLYARPK
jgi:hypothetical protein